MIDSNITKEQIVRETDKAYLVSLGGGQSGFNKNEVWVPKSQIAWSQGQFETLMMQPWMYEKIRNAA
ncbi:unnamed protein product [marine sediment metagenome]|uniref:Uncharacterized protein n=1 Tax=marine sediment metagenome TaxID=412755 RepID=X0U070_9ZZZZ